MREHQARPWGGQIRSVHLHTVLFVKQHAPAAGQRRLMS
jgi:hypothetical protein